MYKVLLCWRYLRTRFLVLVCIVSVMLGVATLIVVNSVMSGFSTKLKERLHGLLSDLVIEAHDYDGFYDPEGKMALIRSDPFLNERIEAMSPTLEIFAMYHYAYNGRPFTHTVKVIGVDLETRRQIGGFAEHLVREDNRHNPTFNLTEEARRHFEKQRRDPWRRGARPFDPRLPPQHAFADPVLDDVPPDFPDAIKQLNKMPPPPPIDPPPEEKFVPTGVIVGHAIANLRTVDPDTGERIELDVLKPGSIATLMTLNSRWTPVETHVVVADTFRSGLSEYDANLVFMDFKELQTLRGLDNRATSIQIRLKDYQDAKVVKDVLQKKFRSHGLDVQTWEDKQGPLLAAISVEKGILNVLLFMIIAVAGFGILAIFSMIVVEKTRDIGILKALGASNWGVLKIFLGYGLLLGLVGAGMGTLLGLTVTHYINEIEHGLAKLTGQEIFDRTLYYFKEIPTDVKTMNLVYINLGAIGIAVFFSIVPALRASMLHPVRALRYE